MTADESPPAEDRRPTVVAFDGSPSARAAIAEAGGLFGSAPAVVVVGSRGRSGIKSALLGSVSNAVINHAERPALVVREPRP